MDPEQATEIEHALRKLIGQIAPQVRYLSKYGGVVLGLDPDDDGKFVGGIFQYKTHVSLEFSEGYSFDDPGGHLEGKGKKRRHLKIQTIADITAKNTESYLQQALVP